MKRTLIACHRWTGIVVGVLLLVQGLTGAAMVFRDELNHALHRQAMTVQPTVAPLPVQTLMDIVRKAHPQMRVERIEYPEHNIDAFVFRLEGGERQGTRYVAIDPYRGTITRDGSLSEWPVEWLFRLHEQLLAGPTGHTLVGIVGVGLLILTLSAPFIWWPGRRNLRRGFTVTLKSGAYRSLRDLHRVGGIIVVLILMTVAATGVVVVWKNALQPVVGSVMPVISRPSPKVAAREDATLRPIDELVASAQARYGGMPVRNVRFPGGHGRVVTVFVKADTRPRASNQIWFDGYTGQALGTYEAEAVPSGNVLFDWMLPIHSGQAFGLLGRLLFLLAALTLPGLAITGWLQWYKRTQMLREARRSQSMNGEAARP